MKPPSDRNRAIAARRADGATATAVAAEFKLSANGVRDIAERVERYDRGIAILRLEPSSLEGLELIGKISKLVRISLQASGIERLEDLDGMSLVDLLRLPNISRRSATTLIDLYARVVGANDRWRATERPR
jgi:hypothetical protein